MAIGAGGLWEEIVALGVPRLSPAARVRALDEVITVVRSLSGGGDPVTFDGEFYQVTELAPSISPAPPIWVGALWRQPLRHDTDALGTRSSPRRRCGSIHALTDAATA